jgi:murein DD-endopeptidase MepM/ murein hydrolase activator NlpD
VGSSSPAWPLASTSRRVSDDVGACRPVGACSAGRGERHHAGEDLVAPRGTLVLAPEAGEVVEVRPSWYEGTGMMLLQTDTGPVFNLGEIEPDSEREFGIVVGSRVVRGQPVARVGWHKMLHFEAYRDGTRTTSQWLLGSRPPASLLDPVPYLELAASSSATPRPTPRPTPATPAVYPTLPDPEPVAPRPSSSSSSGAGLLLAFAAALAFTGDT